MSKPFEAVPEGTVNIDVSGTSQRIALPPGTDCVCVMNNGSATAWYNFGDVTVEAVATTSKPIPPGAMEVVSVASFGKAAYASAIAASTTGKIYFTPGTGI